MSWKLLDLSHQWECECVFVMCSCKVCVCANAKPVYAHLPIFYICVHSSECVFIFCVGVGLQRRLKEGKACVASSALSCSHWQVDNLKSSSCMGGWCLGWPVFKTSAVLFGDTEFAHEKVFLFLSRIPTVSQESFLCNPGTHWNPSVCFGWFDLESELLEADSSMN